MSRSRYIVQLALLLPLLIWASAASGEEPTFNAGVQGLIDSAKLPKAKVAVSVVDVNSGAVLCAINEQELMTPASNVKLFTTSAALLTLGDNYQFTTTLYSSGAVSDGVLNGDLVVVASGDPAISGREHDGQPTAIFDAWAAEAAKTIRAVKGNLVIDDTIFDREYIHPDWPANQLIRWYCAPISAFALNDNCIDVAVRPGAQAGQPAQVVLSPPTSYFQIRNTCVTVAGQGKAVISRLPKSDVLMISGKVGLKDAGAGSPVAVVNPQAFAGTVLKERLAAAGVQVEGDVVLASEGRDVSGMQAIASTSHTLASAVRTANKNSQNFYAEMMLKTLGRKVAEPATVAGGVQAVAAALEPIGVKSGSYVMVDGSGLSKKNQISAEQFSTLLRQMILSAHAQVLIDSLPASGMEGSLKKRMNAPAYAGKVIAKTGHLANVCALSGYIRTDSKLYAFSILINGEALGGTADALQDKICQWLVDVK